MQTPVLSIILPLCAELATMPVPCAWCLREQGAPLGAGSHGICLAHKASELATWRARKLARLALAELARGGQAEGKR